MSQIADEIIPHQIQQGTTPQSKRRFNARDGNRDLHLQVFFGWLHPDLRDIPGVDWKKMPSRLIGYLVNTVEKAWNAPHLTLAAGAALGAMGDDTLFSSISDLSNGLSFIQRHCNSWDGKHLTRAVWEEYAAEMEQRASRRLRILGTYSAFTEYHIPDLMERQTTEVCSRLAPYVLLRLPARFLERYGASREVTAEERRRRKEKSDVLTPLHSILVALVQLRKQAMQRLLHSFREACQRAQEGEALPLCFSYEEDLAEIDRAVTSVADIRLEKRRVTLSFKLWNRQAWINHHLDDFSIFTKKRAQQGKLAYQSANEPYFVEFLGEPDDLLWVGKLVENQVLMHLGRHRQRSRLETLSEKQLQRLAYAESIGAPKGFVIERPGLLTPSGGFGLWLATIIQRFEALIFDPESLYRGCLLGAALATLALTNGGRCTELLQMSADRFKGHEYEEMRNGQPTGNKRVIWLQYLLPKGKKTEAERQLFPISPQSYELLREIAALLKETYGTIPVVQPHFNNSKFEDLAPERYLFQWQASSDGRHGVLGPGDVVLLLKFILHGLEFHTRQGEPFVVSTHLLRHVMATAARQDHHVPPEVMAIVLHHHQAGLAIPVATDYYTEMTEEQKVMALAEFLTVLEEQSANVLLSLPNERTVEQMDEDIREVFERWHVFLETAFGFCGCVGLCPRGYARNLCIGCPHLIPNPRKRENAMNWRASYARQAEELEVAGELVDARQVRLQVQELDTHINEMDMLQQAIDDGTRKPAFLQITAVSSHEVIIDAEA